ncbi:MAG: histidine--tRNA ligase [Bacteroidota bacterium]
MDRKRGIVPRKINGFRDIDPNLNHIKQNIIEAASKVYRLYGFEHWDTPAIEYAENLGKYMPDTDTIGQGVYSFRNPETEPVLMANGKELRDGSNKVVMDNHFLSLRYDLTAPLARHYAEETWQQSLRGQLTPDNAPLFRRFQFGPVYRFEAKLDPGRFREFWQLDFDTVGTKDVSADAEVCMVLSDALEAIGLKRGTYVVKVNNRKILKGLLHTLGIDTEEMEQDILRVVDKYDKIGIYGVKAELGKERKDESGAIITGLNLDQAIVDGIISFLEILSETDSNGFPLLEAKKDLSRASILQKLKLHLKDSEIGNEGIEELTKINGILTRLGYDEERVIFDPTLVRGMAYYTGPIFEVESKQSYKDEKGRERRVGSICGGGRYDGLVKNLNGVAVPATGASIGVDRLAELLMLTNQVPNKVQGPVFIAVFDDELMPEYQKIAAELRENNIATEIYYGSSKGMKKQFKYADKRNASLAIMLGSDEAERGVVSVKDLILGRQSFEIQDRDEWKKRIQSEVKREDLVSFIRKKLT